MLEELLRILMFPTLPHSPTALPHTPTGHLEPKFDLGNFEIISHQVQSIAGSRYESRRKDHAVGRSWSSDIVLAILGFGNLKYYRARVSIPPLS